VRAARPVLGSTRASSKSGQWLALVPLGIALAFAALLLPRSVVPDTVPLPEIDARVVAREMRADVDRVERAKRAPLSYEVRAFGSAIVAFNRLEAEEAKDLDMSNARADIERTRRDVIDRGLDDELLSLRAAQLEGFLGEVRRFERTGEIRVALEELGGTFVRRMRKVGWCQDHTCVLDDLQRRSAFKATWNTLVGFDKEEAFKLSEMETRALYTLYFAHPHAPEPQRDALMLARRGAADQATCDRIADGERAGAQAWLLTKLGEYGPLDPSYPLQLARGIALYHRRQYADAARAFGRWLEEHPNGPWTLRAKNYLRAATTAEEATF